MSLELHDLGSVKVSQRDASYLTAKAKSLGVTVVALARQLIHDGIQREFDVMNVAADIHESKGFGDIFKDAE